MKEYLVACSLGGGKISAFAITAGEIGDDGYIPASDNMQKLKEAVVEKYHPKVHYAYAAPDRCGGYVAVCEENTEYTADSLDIIAVSRLDL